MNRMMRTTSHNWILLTGSLWVHSLVGYRLDLEERVWFGTRWSKTVTLRRPRRGGGEFWSPLEFGHPGSGRPLKASVLDVLLEADANWARLSNNEQLDLFGVWED